MGHDWEESRLRPWIMCAILLLCGAVILVFNALRQPSQAVFLEEVGSSGEDHVILRTPSTVLSRHHDNWYNVLVEESNNYTDTLIELLDLNASSKAGCHHEWTNSTKLEGLPRPIQGKFIFQTDVIHRLTLVAYGADGRERCAGGDYYEVDFHDRENLRYRSRPPTVDFGNGSYGLELTVPSRFAGAYTVQIRLLFGNFHGMDRNPEPWMKDKLMFTQELEMVGDEEYRSLVVSTENEGAGLKHTKTAVKNLTRCTHVDFDQITWQGRWTRGWFNDACVPDTQKRYRCIPEEHFDCEEPWCFGPVGRLESNGWSYPAHCSFRIFTRKEAWDCLDGRWLLLWGDSNFQDTMRNLLIFILDWDIPVGKTLANFQLERIYEAAFVNRFKYDQQFRVSQHFNGANAPWIYGVGLNTLQNEMHQQALLAHFNGTRWPDTLFMNSGLHDGTEFKGAKDYAESADYAIEWWTKLYESIDADKRPLLVWRTTVTPAGLSRKMASNPNKMEMFNQMMVEKLQQARDKLPVRIIDTLDLTFPFHYGNDYSDGGHYGRAPGTNLKPWRGGPHWYFVDIMLGHIFLNAVCPNI